MTPEQKELFDKLTTLQQEVAKNAIAGMSDIDAYRHSSGKAKTESAQRASVSEILANPNVKKFIDLVKEDAVKGAVMSRQEMLERLSSLSRTSLTDLVEWKTETILDENELPVEQSMWQIKDSAAQDPLKMAAIQELTSGAGGIKIKTLSQLQAMKQLAELAGYDEPVKQEVTVKAVDDWDDC